MNYKNVYDDETIKIDRSEHGWHLWARPAVTTLLVKNSKVMVIYEKKDSTGRWVWNCPGGMVEKEDASEEAAAARECEEELGIIPKKLVKFARIQTEFPDTYNDYFLGSELDQGQKKNWAGEEIQKVEEYSWDEIYQKALNCEFNDPRLVVAILLLAKQSELLVAHGLK